jgi:hypothetical protein
LCRTLDGEPVLRGVAGGGVVCDLPPANAGEDNTPAEKKLSMKITVIAAAGAVAGTLITASPARADVATQPALTHLYPQQPTFSLSPQSDAEEVRREIADLDAAWGRLKPAERNQRLTQIQQQLTTLDFETRNMPQDQKAGVDLVLLPSLVNLGRLVGKAQGPNQPCYFPACLPGL